MESEHYMKVIDTERVREEGRERERVTWLAPAVPDHCSVLITVYNLVKDPARSSDLSPSQICDPQKL